MVFCFSWYCALTLWFFWWSQLGSLIWLDLERNYAELENPRSCSRVWFLGAEFWVGVPQVSFLLPCVSRTAWTAEHVAGFWEWKLPSLPKARARASTAFLLTCFLGQTSQNASLDSRGWETESISWWKEWQRICGPLIYKSSMVP